MSEPSAATFPFDTAGPESIVDFRPLESRRMRRARLEAAEVAVELGNANPPLGSPVTRAEIFGAVFLQRNGTAGTEPESV